MASEPHALDHQGSVELDAISAVLGLLHRAVQGLALYSSDHPSVMEASAALEQQINASPSPDGASVGVARDHFLWGEQIIQSEGLSQLASMLYTLEIGALVARPGVTQQQALGLACTICDARRAALRGEQLAQEIDRCTGGRITITPMSFSGLTVREGASHEEDASAQISWSSLIDSLLHPHSGASDEQHAHSTGDVDRAIQNDPEHAHNAGRHILHAWDQTAHMVPDAALQGRQRIHSFLQNLSGDTRKSIVESCLCTDEPAVVRQCAEVFQPTDVLSSLENIQASGASLSLETMKLLQKLSHLQPEHTGDASTPDDVDLEQAVGTLLGQQSAEEEYLPQDYGRQIDSCVMGRTEASGATSWNYDDANLPFHKAEIGLELLHDSSSADEAGADAVFGFLCEHLDQWISAGKIGIIARATREAQRQIFASVSVESNDAAKELLTAIDDEDRVGRMILTAWTTDRDRADLVALFREAAHLLVHVPRILEKGSHESARAAAELMLEMPEVQLRTLMNALATTDLISLRAMLDVLTALPGSRFSALLASLLEHDDRKVRRMAYGVLGGTGAPWRVDLLRRGLADDDFGVQRVTLEQLRGRTDPDAIEALAGLLVGTARRPSRAWNETYQSAASILTASGPDGVRRTCAALGSRLASFGRTNAAIARTIAGVLADHRADPDVRRTLARWSWSTARLVGVLIGARLPEHGGSR